jgi:hypothetical protein
MHKWDKKWNNDRSDGTRVETIDRTCIHCGARQRVIYSQGVKWARVVQFDNAGREIPHLEKCIKSDIEEEPEMQEPDEAVTAAPPTRNRKAKTEQAEERAKRVPAVIDLKVTMIIVNPEQLQDLITRAVKEQFEKIFKTA